MVTETFYRPFLVNKDGKLETLPGWTGYKKRNPLYYWTDIFSNIIKRYNKNIIVNKYLMYKLSNTGELDLFKSIKFNYNYMNTLRNLKYNIRSYWIKLLYKGYEDSLLERIFNEDLLGQSTTEKRTLRQYSISMVKRQFGLKRIEKITIELTRYSETKKLELTFDNVEETKKQLKELTKYY